MAGNWVISLFFFSVTTRRRRSPGSATWEWITRRSSTILWDNWSPHSSVPTAVTVLSPSTPSGTSPCQYHSELASWGCRSAWTASPGRRPWMGTRNLWVCEIRALFYSVFLLRMVHKLCKIWNNCTKSWNKTENGVLETFFIEYKI